MSDELSEDYLRGFRNGQDGLTRRILEEWGIPDRIAILEAALKPFADAADRMDKFAPTATDEAHAPSAMRLGDLRRARSLLLTGFIPSPELLTLPSRTSKVTSGER